MTRYAFIYNPAACDGQSEVVLDRLKQKLSTLRHARLFRSKTQGDTTPLVGDLLDDYDVFVACGGDGTVQEVAAALIGTSKVMGIIPMGTGNDLCKTLQIPTNPDAAFEVIKQGQSNLIDVGLCNGNIFLNSLGYGFDGLTNRFALQMRYLPSFMQYVIGALRATIYHCSFDVEIKTTEGQRCSQKLIMITLANGRVEGGSFWIAPEADISDGRLELVTIQPVTKWMIPFLLIFFLIKKPDWIPHVKIQEVSEVSLYFDQIPEMHADGEVFNTEGKEFYISLIRNGLEVLS